MSFSKSEPGPGSDASPSASSLLENLRAVAQADLQAADFYREFLGRVVTGLSAVAGAIWATRGHELRLEHQIGLGDTGVVGDAQRNTRHIQLLQDVMAAGEPRFAPSEQDADHVGSFEGPPNSSGYPLLIAPLRRGGETVGLIEVFQRTECSAASARGYLRFLAKACDLADGTARAAPSSPHRTAGSIPSLEAFSRAVHASLDLEATCHAVANETRRLLDCDRVCVAVTRGQRSTIRAISGLATIDSRSSTVRALEKLAAAVGAMGEPLWYADGDGTRELPPQVEEALEEYVDLSHVKFLGLLPLATEVPPDPARTSSPASTRVGVLIVERVSAIGDRRPAEARAASAAPHVALALANAAQYEGLFLLPLWRALGRAQALLFGKWRNKTLLGLGVAVVVLLILALVPADFALEARGVLLPVRRREVFARADGDITAVHVRHGEQVQASDLLVELRSTELETRGAALEGERLATREQLDAVEEALLGRRGLTETERVHLHGERHRLAQQLSALELQWTLHEQMLEELQIASPIAGEVVTWDVDDLLLERPVRRGDVLLSVVEPGGEWELELEMPEDRMGHIGRARHQQGPELPVDFVLATDPGKKLTGTVSDVEQSAEVRGEEGNTVLVRVEIDRGDLTEPRYGAEVVARVHCGQRSLGYVWFHDVWAFVQKRVLFRL